MFTSQVFGFIYWPNGTMQVVPLVPMLDPSMLWGSTDFGMSYLLASLLYLMKRQKMEVLPLVGVWLSSVNCLLG